MGTQSGWAGTSLAGAGVAAGPGDRFGKCARAACSGVLVGVDGYLSCTISKLEVGIIASPSHALSVGTGFFAFRAPARVEQRMLLRSALRAVPPRSAGAGAGWPPTPPEEERERRARRPSGNPRAADSSLLLRSPQEEERVPQPELSLRRRGHEPADPRSDAGGAGEGGRLGPFLVPDGDDAVVQRPLRPEHEVWRRGLGSSGGVSTS